MRFRPKRLVPVLAAICLFACTSKNTPVPNAAEHLRSIPAASPGKYERVRDMKKWRNPYLIIRTDGVGLLDPADNAEILLKPEELLDRLAQLPASAWPYGRVVAVAENSTRKSEQDGVAIRRNKGIIGGILESAQIAIEWVPAA